METKRFIITLITILVIAGIWITLFWFMYNRADYIRKDPCSVCAEFQGDDVFCTTMGATRTYYANGSIETDYHPTRDVNLPEFNSSLVEVVEDE